MAEVAVFRPGMVGLRNKKTKEVTYHFPVDVAEINKFNPGVFELASDGSVEAARLAMTPLRQAIASNPETTAMEVAGVEGTAAAFVGQSAIATASVVNDGKPKDNIAPEATEMTPAPAKPTTEKK